MNEPDEIQAYMDQAARMLGLPIQPQHYAEVLAAFRVLATHAAQVMAFELPEGTQAAPRFTP